MKDIFFRYNTVSPVLGDQGSITLSWGIMQLPENLKWKIQNVHLDLNLMWRSDRIYNCLLFRTMVFRRRWLSYGIGGERESQKHRAEWSS
jgi:hypothetical protein